MTNLFYSNKKLKKIIESRSFNLKKKLRCSVLYTLTLQNNYIMHSSNKKMDNYTLLIAQTDWSWRINNFYLLNSTMTIIIQFYVATWVWRNNVENIFFLLVERVYNVELGTLNVIMSIIEIEKDFVWKKGDINCNHLWLAFLTHKLLDGRFIDF